MSIRRFTVFGVLFASLLALGTVAVPTTHAAATTITVNSLADSTGTCSTSGTGTCTVRDALTFSNSSTNSTQRNIVFSVTGTIKLTSSLPPIQNWLTLSGTNQQVTISGENAHRIFTIRKRGVVTINALTLTKGAGKADCGSDYNCAGAVKNRGALTVQNSVLSSNNGDWLGGAIDNEGPSLTVNNSTFTNNVTSAYYGMGSAIYNIDGDVQIKNSIFDGNNGFYGGAIYHGTSALTIDSSSFDSNESEQGGAIFADGGYLTLTNSTFTNNQLVGAPTGTEGAAIYSSATTQVSNSTFTNNQTCTYCYGGAIANAKGTLTVRNSSFSDNYSQYGGAIYNDSGGLIISKSTMNHNQGWEGGGALYNSAGTVSLTNTTITDNQARAGNGGGLYNLDGAITLTNSTVWSNFSFRSAFDAGGIYNDGISVKLYNTIVASNSNYQCYDYAESITADKYNLDDDGSCNDATQKTPAQIGLGALQNNGGPTQTLKPAKGSAVIDAANNADCPSTDQRGVKRPQGPICDVGAYEVRQ